MKGYENAIVLAAEHLGELLDIDAILQDPEFNELLSEQLYEAIRARDADNADIQNSWDMFSHRITVICDLFFVDPIQVMEDTERQLLRTNDKNATKTLH